MIKSKKKAFHKTNEISENWEKIKPIVVSKHNQELWNA